MRISDWSSDVCSSDLRPKRQVPRCDNDAQGTWWFAARHRRVRWSAQYTLGTEAVGPTLPAPRRITVSRAVRVRFPKTRVDHSRQSHEDAPRSEEHTSELPSLMRISYAVFCLQNKKQRIN